MAYWRTVGTDGFSAAKGFPVFINYEQPSLIYGMPCLEFPGLLKVSVCVCGVPVVLTQAGRSVKLVRVVVMHDGSDYGRSSSFVESAG